MSKIFTSRVVNTINKMGDLMLPATSDTPSFSQTGCIEHIDYVLENTNPEEIRLVKNSLLVLSWMPHFMLRMFHKSLKNSFEKNNMRSGMLIRLNLGLRGIIHSCYYSGKTGANYKGKSPVELKGK